MKHKESMSGDWKGLRLHSYSVWHDPEMQRLSFPSSSWLSFGLHIIAHNCSGWVCCYLGLKEVSDKHAMQDSESSMLCRHEDKDSWGTSPAILAKSWEHKSMKFPSRSEDPKDKPSAISHVFQTMMKDSLFTTVLAVHQVCDGLIVTLISNPC